MNGNVIQGDTRSVLNDCSLPKCRHCHCHCHCDDPICSLWRCHITAVSAQATENTQQGQMCLQNASGPGQMTSNSVVQLVHKCPQYTRIKGLVSKEQLLMKKKLVPYLYSK